MKFLSALMILSALALADGVVVTKTGPSCNGVTDNYVYTASSNKCVWAAAGGGSAITSLTTDVTATGPGAAVATIASGAVTNAKMANVSTATFKGRTTAGTGAPEDLTATQATALLNAMVGDSGAGGTKGLVPAPASGDAAAGKFLKANGTWATAGSLSGPGSSTNNAVAIWNGTGGNALADSQLVLTPGTLDVAPLQITSTNLLTGPYPWFRFGSTNARIEFGGVNGGIVVNSSFQSGGSNYATNSLGYSDVNVEAGPFHSIFLNGALYLAMAPHDADPGAAAGTVYVKPGTPMSLNADSVNLTGSLKAPALSTSSSATTGTMCWTTGTGNVNIDTTTTCLLSASKYKQDVLGLDIGLAQVMKMKPVSYQLKSEYNPAKLGRMIGFIAEDVAAIDNRLVAYEDNGGVHGVRYFEMAAVLAKAIQEQQAQIQAHEARIVSLESSIASLLARVTALEKKPK